MTGALGKSENYCRIRTPRENGLDTNQVLCVLMFTRRCVPNVTICKSTVYSEPGR